MENTHYLIFSLNNSLYALEAFCVQEILFLPEVTPIPEVPLDIVGIINLRGKILPIIDLNIRLGYQLEEYSINDSIIVIDYQEFKIGIIANQVHEIQNILPENITTDLSRDRLKKNTPKKINLSKVLAGFAKIDANLIMVINLDNLITYVEKCFAEKNIDTITNNQNIETPDDKPTQSSIINEHHRVFCPHATPEEKIIFQERAENLRRSIDSEDSKGLIPLAVIGLNSEYFGLDLQLIREFTDIRQTTPIPCCPPHIIGNMNLRGEILTLIDIRGFLNLSLSGNNTSKTMVIHINDLVVGIIVDEVYDVTYIQPSEIMPIPIALHSGNEEYLRGTINYAEKMMSILDLAKLLSQEELIVSEDV